MESKRILGSALFLMVLVALFMFFRNASDRVADTKVQDIDIDSPFNMNTNSFEPPSSDQLAKKDLPNAPGFGSFKPPAFGKVPVKTDKAKKVKKIADKKDDKKKKKKKKVAKKKKPIDMRQAYLAPDAQHTKVNQPKDELKNDAPTAIYANTAATNKPTNLNESEEVTDDTTTSANKKTLQEWEALLLSDPSPEKAMTLVMAYQSNQLQNKNWLFQIAHKLLLDNRPAAKQSALVILNQVPSSQSFAILASYYDRVSEDERLLIGKSMQVYAARLSHLNYLTSNLNSSDDAVKGHAIRLISEAAQIHLNAGSSSLSRIARNYNQSNPPQNSFQSILPILAQLAEKDQNPDIQKISAEAFAHLEQLLNRNIVSSL